MAVITTGAHPKELWPGIHKMFGRTYDEKPMRWQELFRTQDSSDKAYEEDVEGTSFGLPVAKPEATAVTYDDMNQTNVAKYTHAVYALGAKVSAEAISDGKYESLATVVSRALAFSLRQGKEIIGANIFNNGFDSNFTGADGKELFATDHPTRYGDQRNELNPSADFSEAALEDLLIDIRNVRNSRGLRIGLTATKLAVPSALMFEAQRVVMSNLQSGTANNDLNALKNMGMLPEGITVNEYFNDDDAFFVLTDAPVGLTMFQRWKRDLTRDNEFDTMNACMKAVERYSFGWSDWRAAFASSGAA